MKQSTKTTIKIILYSLITSLIIVVLIHAALLIWNYIPDTWQTLAYRFLGDIYDRYLSIN
jgi:hypothetical protein